MGEERGYFPSPKIAPARGEGPWEWTRPPTLNMSYIALWHTLSNGINTVDDLEGYQVLSHLITAISRFAGHIYPLFLPNYDRVEYVHYR